MWSILDIPDRYGEISDVGGQIRVYERSLQVSLKEGLTEIPTRRNFASNFYSLLNLRILSAMARLGLENMVSESDPLDAKFSMLLIFYPEMRAYSSFIQEVFSFRNKISHTDSFAHSHNLLIKSYSKYSDFVRALESLIRRQDERSRLRSRVRDEFAFKREEVGLWIETIPSALKRNYEANSERILKFKGTIESLTSINTHLLDDESVKELASALDTTVIEFDRFLREIQSFCPDCGSKLESVEEQRYVFPGNPDNVDQPIGIAYTAKIVCKKCDKDIEILNREVIDI